jgi:hypothetical protein
LSFEESRVFVTKDKSKFSSWRIPDLKLTEPKFVCGGGCITGIILGSLALILFAYCIYPSLRSLCESSKNTIKDDK